MSAVDFEVLKLIPKMLEEIRENSKYNFWCTIFLYKFDTV